MTEATKELTVVERAAVALHTADHEKNLIALVKKSETISEIKNAAGRDQCHAAYMVLKNARGDIEKIGKAARDDATKFSKAVIAEEARLIAITQTEETRLKEIRDAWDARIAAEKQAKIEAEARRLAQIRDNIEELRRAPSAVPGRTSAELDEHADDLAAVEISEDIFAEGLVEARAVRDASVSLIRKMAQAAREREAEEKRIADEQAAEAARIAAERAELARLRAEQEERERVAAASRAEQEAKDKVAREAREAQERAAREAHEKRMAEERAELQRKLDAAAAEQAAARAELQRQQDELAAQRRKEADEAARVKREAEIAAAQAAREEAERAAAEQARREAADTALRNAAPMMLEVLLMVQNSTQFPAMESRVKAAVNGVIDAARGEV